MTNISYTKLHVTAKSVFKYDQMCSRLVRKVENQFLVKGLRLRLNPFSRFAAATTLSCQLKRLLRTVLAEQASKTKLTSTRTSKNSSFCFASLFN